MSKYQGHLPDGSSVQRHSAGGLYPFVLFAQNTAEGTRWGVIFPGGAETEAKFTYDQAVCVAEAEKAAYDVRRAPRPFVHYVGDPVEVGIFERSPKQQLDDRWSNMRDADFNIGPGC